jgi:two-component system LytT family sensor kinase
MWIGVGCLFALQEYAELYGGRSRTPLRYSLLLWSLYSAVGASGFIAVWVCLRERIETASWRFLAFCIAPISLVLGLAQVMLFVRLLPLVVVPYVQRTYWDRLGMVLRADFVSYVVFFWIALFIARGIVHHERSRQNEMTASRLETELVGAQLRALRVQLNPHFLFNTMNGISSLMRHDPDGADKMLEQLSCLLRMTLDRGEIQQVTLGQEIEFVQIYLDIQQTRFGERARYELQIQPEALDALIPTMILQPIVENAYRHGIAASGQVGYIRIEALIRSGQLILNVLNTGTGLRPEAANDQRSGIGLSNVRSRLSLHYQARQTFTLKDIAPELTEARLTLPLQYCDQGAEGLLT